MNIEQALKILGGNFAHCFVADRKNQTYSNKEHGGLSVCFRYSKEYNVKEWWTSEYPVNVDDSDFLIIALQHKGLLVLPRKVVQNQYWDGLKVSTLKQGRRNIRIKEDNGKTVLYNRTDQPFIDVSEYLRPCEIAD